MDNSAVYYRISKLYDSFVTTTGNKSRYFFMLDISSDVARWSQEAVKDFALPGEYVHHQSQVFRELLAPEDAAEFSSDLAAITARRLERKDAVWRLLDRNGNYLACAVKYFAVKDYASTPAYIAGVITSKGVEPHTDPTTSLPNQVRFLEHLRQLFVTGRRAVIMLIGTTNFAEINTLYGYTFGNKVLSALADHLKEISNGAGQLFRGEGTMLLFCSERMNEAEMRRLYTGQRNYARHMLTIENTRINVQLSAGIVVADDPTIDVHAILACVKFAQTKSQNEVEGEPVVLQNDYLNDNGKTIELVNRIHSDVENNCRNFDCEPFGRISPAEFLLWLENDSSFSRLGNWILKTAISEGKKILEKNPDLILNVNLANRQLEQPEFHQQLLSYLKEQNFPGKNLCLELTDRCRFLNEDFLKREVIYLRSCGIHVALDGSCLLDLRLVRSLPVDIIKVGRDFVGHMKSEKKDQALLRALCAFAAESGIMICAEGISDEATLAMIREYDIYAYQGFVTTGPIPFADFMRLPI